jgi:polyketide synthase PksM
VRLAQVFGRQALDFIVMFSSLQSFTKSAGQSNYAAGCAFVDAFAMRLAEEFPIKVINWGYWGAVGAVSSTEHRDRMRSHGFESIESSEGMSALEVLLSSRLPQLVYVKTNSDATLARFVGDDAVSCLLDGGAEHLRAPGESRGETFLRTTSDSETGASA